MPDELHGDFAEQRRAGDHADKHANFDKLAQDARLEHRMVKDDQPLTQADIDRVLAAARDYIERRKAAATKYGLKEFASELGTLTTGTGRVKRPDESVLSDLLNGKYKGAIDPYIRRIDALLARERLRGQRMNVDEFVEIELARRVRGVVHAAKVNSSIGLVIMHPGQGKTKIAQACERLDSGAVLLTIKEGEGSVYAILHKLYDAFNIPGNFRDPMRRIRLFEHLASDRTVMFLIDEAQHLAPKGLEFLRGIHDNADSFKRGAGHAIPMVLFADHEFYKIVQQGRRGGGRVKSQLVSRMFPVFDSDDAGTFKGRGRGRERECYGVEDLVKILRNDRLRIVTDDGIQFLARLANIPHYGALRTAINSTRMAYTLAGGRQIGVKHLKQSLRMMLSERVASLLITMVESELAKEEKVAAAATA